MDRAENSLQSIFSKNRAEELGYDVWKYFVIPPFYDKLDLQTARKPRLIIGGRGCGKTMLLRYLSHQSMFSKDRLDIPDNAITHIGLCWRADTQFANAMSKRGIEDDVWEAAFSHMAALILGMEVLDSLDSVAGSHLSLLSIEDINRLSFRRLQAFDITLPDTTKALRENLEEKLWAFENWVNNVRKVSEPNFLPGSKFVLAIIQLIQQQVENLRDATYFVYLDEYENLCTYQQKIINTWLKHSEVPLIFNIAMKRNAFETRDTTGSESLSDIHDFRTHDLEEYFLDEKFPVFFAEILFLKLSMAEVEGLPISAADLRNPAKLTNRRDPIYTKQVLTAINTMLPSVSELEIAQEVFRDQALSDKLRKRIDLALKYNKSSLPIDKFFRPNHPQATIVVPALLYRKGCQPEMLVQELDLLELGKKNRFTGRTNWIHNNFIGCLLQLYEPHTRACPFYAGFNTFCLLSRGNIRHFLELCHKSITRAFRNGIAIGQPNDPVDQAEAARQVSVAFLGEIKSFGRYGNQLHTFVLRLGSLFALAHQRPSQSESEQSHFSIGSGSQILSEADQQFLREAEKWSVLFEEAETKKKGAFDPEAVQYVLNPIYAPYFHISYRKRRKLKLATDDVICLIRGPYEGVADLLKRYSRTWAIEPDEMSPTLFSHLVNTDQE